MTKNYVCRTPYLSKHSSFDCVFCFQIFDFRCCWVVGGEGGGHRGGGELKWQKMTQNDKKNFVSLLISGTALHMTVVLVHLCKMMISPAVFFHFFKILIFQVFQTSSINAKRKFRCVPVIFLF